MRIRNLQKKNSIPRRLKPITRDHIDPLTGARVSNEAKFIPESFLKKLKQKKTTENNITEPTEKKAAVIKLQSAARTYLAKKTLANNWVN